MNLMKILYCTLGGHTWIYYVDASSKAGGTSTWKGCLYCGKKVAEGVAKHEDFT